MIQNPADTGTTTHLTEEQRTSINDTLTIQYVLNYYLSIYLKTDYK